MEDDSGIRSIVAECLEQEGYAVSAVSNGQEALDSVQRSRPHAIVLDLMMPVMDGWTFVESCHAHSWCRGVPIVVMSASHALGIAAERLHNLGVRAVIAKPFEIDALVGVVRRYAPVTSD